jgi:hypothetical protein
MALVDHVIVLAHLQPQVIAPPPSVTWESMLLTLGLPADKVAELPAAAREQAIGVAGEPVVSHSALDISRSGIVTEVDWPCGCGIRLHAHHELVLAAWARHVAPLEGIDADHLELHPIQEIDGRWRPDGNPRVRCLCGAHLESATLIPDLAAWEAHVRAS